MFFRHFDIVEPSGIQLRQCAPYFFPFLRRCFFRGGVLSRTGRTLLVKDRLSGIKLNQAFLWFRFYLRNLLLKFLRPKAAVIAPDTGPIIETEPLIVLPEIVFQFLLKCPLAEGIGDLRLLIVGFIHLPGCLQRCSVLAFEHHIGVHHKVIEIVGGPQHSNRNIVIVEIPVCQINFLTVISNGSQFKVNLFHDGLVFLGVQLISAGGDINQPSNQAGLGVCNPDRLIGAHKEKCFEPIGIGRFELFVDGHQLMRYQTVESGVILDTGEVSIMLDRHQRIALKCLQSKGITG